MFITTLLIISLITNETLAFFIIKHSRSKQENSLCNNHVPLELEQLNQN